MSTFQIIVISFFCVCIALGVGVFAIFGGTFGSSGVGSVVIWGTFDEEKMSYVMESMRSVDSALQDTTYIKKDALTYRSDLLNAMAAGTGPDLFVVSMEDIGAFADKVLPIPYSTISQAQFASSYIDEGQLLLTNQGALGLPFLIDPLVMYWNRDLFAVAGVANPPQYWNDFLTLAPKITALDQSQAVKKSAVAMGEWQNVDNAKAILSTLFLQAGDSVTARGEGGALVVTLGAPSTDADQAPAEAALQFYTEFANPSKTTYSWNRSLPRSSTAFTGGQLAAYFGFASEYKSIIERNPNLRFGVAKMPQLQGNGPQITFGTLLALTVPLGARNKAGAMIVAQKLTSATAAGILAGQTGLPPARRDVALDTSANAVAATFVQSALLARGWMDPSPTETTPIFKTMVESVVSGKLDPLQAVSRAAQQMTALLPARSTR